MDARSRNLGGLIRSPLDDPHLYSVVQRLVSADYRAARRLIRQELTNASVVIDLGCGTGNLAGLFDRVRYVGVDINAAHVAFASRVFKRPFVVMDVTRLGFGENGFDAAVAVGLCHHLDDEAVEILAHQLRRVCKSTARILVVDITRPSRWNLPERARQKWGERGKYIRSLKEHCDLLASYLVVEKAYHIRSGFLEYSVLVCRVGI